MTAADSTDDQTIRATLVDAGWVPPPEDRFGAPTFTYDNGRMSIEVERERGRSELIVTFESEVGALTVYPVYGDRLQETLDAIISIQDSISQDTLQSSVARLVRACPEVYVQQGDDDEPMLLEDDLAHLELDGG